jgi:hydroxypyruvate isomerase
MRPIDDPKPTLRRRDLMLSAGAALLGASALPAPATADPGPTVIKNRRIRQSLVHWCYADAFPWPRMIDVATRLGCESIELLDPKYFPDLKAAGLTCAIASIDMAPDPPFRKGFNNPENHPRVIKATTDSIDACARFGYKRVICFTGFADGISPEDGARNCVEGFKKVLGHAEKNGVTLCLEMLNTRATDHPMKGHPGYQGDHTDYCVDIIKRVGSPNLKLLFDIYHVQIMDGDLVRRIHQLRDVIGHVHTAGNPGRGELDQDQEIQYPAVMKALLDVGYDGYVGQEFIPTRDPLAGLEQAVAL